MKPLFVLCASLLTGCAALESPPTPRVQRAHGEQNVSIHKYINEPHPIADEIRLFDTRVFRRLRQSDTHQQAIFLNDPQKTAIIVAAALIGAYLISEWIEDELPPPPGP